MGPATPVPDVSRLSMFAFLSRLFGKKRHTSEAPIHMLLDALLRDAFVRKADKIFFGEPNDSYPRTPRSNDPPLPNGEDLAPVLHQEDQEIKRIEHELEKGRQEMAELGREFGDIGYWSSTLDLNYRSLLPNDEIPIWFRRKEHWHEQGGLPFKLLPDLTGAIEERFTVRTDEWSAKNRNQLLFNFSDDCQYFIEATLTLEANYCYSLELKNWVPINGVNNKER